MARRHRLRLLFACLLAMLPPSFAADRELLIVSYDYPPFMQAPASPGQPATGMMIDVVREAFRRMDVPMKIVLNPFSRNLALLETGKADALFTIKKTPERLRNYRFSAVPVLHQDYVIFVGAQSRLAFHGDLQALAGVSVGVVNKASYGSVFDESARRGVFHHLELAQSHEANFRKLLAGRMDALVCGRAVGLAVLKKLHARQRAKVIGPPVEVAPSYIMFNKQTVSAALVGKFDQTLLAMRNDGTFAKIERAHQASQFD